MRILIFSDIHANLAALEAVLSAAGDVDAAWCLGDLVGYGPNPNECIERVRALPNLLCVLGNHDAAALGYIELSAFNYEAQLSVLWTQNHLTRSSELFLRNLPDKLQNGDVTLAHGSPRNPVWEYLLDLQTADINFDYFETRLCFVGHTHLPIVFYRPSPMTNEVNWKTVYDGEVIRISGRAILNPGSVGQPRDHNPMAAYMIFHPEDSSCEFFRVSYNVTDVQERIYEAGLPLRHAVRLSEGW
ncbi:MAG: metallophosphoesterase family protein [Anaerolineae bacterium]|nr:metallophosphoesterase family protein [Anaerolineae bacterium]